MSNTKLETRTDRLITKEGYAELLAQIEELEGPGRREIAERIKEARDFGDISENSEYESAKNDQALLETRIAQLRERMALAEVVTGKGKAGVVGVGSKVVFEDARGKHQMEIVGHGEADIARGKMSAASPTGTAMMGAVSGDELKIRTPSGKINKIKVLKVS